MTTFLNSFQVRVIVEPSDFYNELCSQINSATRRITLASLYLGNGKHEQHLVSCTCFILVIIVLLPNINILINVSSNSMYYYVSDFCGDILCCYWVMFIKATIECYMLFKYYSNQ